MMLLASLVGFVVLVVSTSEAKIWLDVFSAPRVFLRTADCGGFLKILPVKLLFFINSYVGFVNLAVGFEVVMVSLYCGSAYVFCSTSFSGDFLPEAEATVVMEFLAAMFWMLHQLDVHSGPLQRPPYMSKASWMLTAAFLQRPSAAACVHFKSQL
ncbi:hypothetical protein F2Q68_00010883 [Brassica cretica]|uniref:Uncharacterized protein n=1 Tax=Brassica cretica TaxID=69181 RepID=A0A8S9KVU4_BRACR|nr:hypothetical protein F2Q68_00010883 [Brassica cretica]